MYGILQKLEGRIGEAQYSAEEICLFRLIDFLLRRGWKFLGCRWNGKEYRIRIKNPAAGQETPHFKSNRPYWHSIDAEGNLF